MASTREQLHQGLSVMRKHLVGEYCLKENGIICSGVHILWGKRTQLFSPIGILHITQLVLNFYHYPYKIQYITRVSLILEKFHPPLIPKLLKLLQLRFTLSPPRSTKILKSNSPSWPQIDNTNSTSPSWPKIDTKCTYSPIKRPLRIQTVQIR